MGNINLMGNIDFSIIFFIFNCVSFMSDQYGMVQGSLGHLICFYIFVMGYLDNWIGIFGSEATIITTTNCGYLTDITGGLCHSNNLYIFVVGLKFAYIWTGIFDRYDWWCIGG